ncbi:MAG: hypothetical protein ACFUZC_04425 [Chthoniobacteraceae bacterium]
MKFQITPAPKGAYMTDTGAPVDILPSEHGKDYADEVTFSAALKLTLRAAYAARQTDLAKLQQEFDENLAKGYHDATLGITIAIEDADRRQFNDLDTHLTRKGTMDNATITIKLMDGTLHTIAYGDFHQLIIRAGDYYLALWTALQQQKAAL